VRELKKIWAFGLPYLRPYMFRFVAGVALGMIFGLSNGLFVVSVDSFFTRLTQPAQVPIQSVPHLSSTQILANHIKYFSRLKLIML
jgi:hypothetical protein